MKFYLRVEKNDLNKSNIIIQLKNSVKMNSYCIESGLKSYIF